MLGLLVVVVGGVIVGSGLYGRNYWAVGLGTAIIIVGWLIP